MTEYSVSKSPLRYWKTLSLSSTGKASKHGLVVMVKLGGSTNDGIVRIDQQDHIKVSLGCCLKSCWDVEGPRYVNKLKVSFIFCLRKVRGNKLEGTSNDQCNTVRRYLSAAKHICRSTARAVG